MAAITPTNAPRHVTGDIAVRFYTLSAVADADTLTVPGITQILDVIITPNATVGAGNDPAAVWTGNVITFHSGGAWSGTIAVFSRVG